MICVVSVDGRERFCSCSGTTSTRRSCPAPRVVAAACDARSPRRTTESTVSPASCSARVERVLPPTADGSPGRERQARAMVEPRIGRSSVGAAVAAKGINREGGEGRALRHRSASSTRSRGAPLPRADGSIATPSDSRGGPHATSTRAVAQRSRPPPVEHPKQPTAFSARSGPR